MSRQTAQDTHLAFLRDLLIEMGCDLIQGFLYSEGVPADRVPEIIDRIERRR